MTVAIGRPPDVSLRFETCPCLETVSRQLLSRRYDKDFFMPAWSIQAREDSPHHSHSRPGIMAFIGGALDPKAC